VASTERRPIPWLRGSAPHSTPISANRPPGYTEAGDFAPAMLRLVYPFGAHKVEMERERAGGRWRTACCQLQPCRGDLPVLAAAAPVPRPGPGTVQGLQRHRGIEPERLGSTASAGSDGARSRAYRNR